MTRQQARHHRTTGRVAPVGIGMVFAVFLGLAFEPSQARAVLVFGDGTSGLGQNTSAPTGLLFDSGWQYEGVWQSTFAGTPIAPNYFITSQHLFGNVGDTFTYNGTSYTTTGFTDDPSGSDLRIWKVNGTFSSYAPIYTGNDEVGKDMTVFGHGSAKGAAVTMGGNPVGWFWTASPAGLTWGTNVVTTAGTVLDPNGQPSSSQFLVYQFNPSLGPNTAALSGGDSGGGVFIQQNGVWKLAGVNFSADGLFNRLPKSDPNYNPADAFAASLFDDRGFYYDGTNILAGKPSDPNPDPTSSYSTRLSNEIAWISSVTGVPVPEPGSLGLLLGGLLIVIVAPHWRRGRAGFGNH
jgi:hypothetical protein